MENHQHAAEGWSVSVMRRLEKRGLFSLEWRRGTLINGEDISNYERYRYGKPQKSFPKINR